MQNTIRAKGEYFERINGGEWVKSDNLVTDEGLTHILNVAFGTTPKPQAYYVALYGASATPQPNWTAQNFASTASEIVSMSEGYNSATRPKWTPENTSSNSIDSIKSAAVFNIVTDSTLTVQGAGLITSANKGSTDGVLVSAIKFNAPRTFQNGDVYEIGYRISLTV
ncbi:hypothetical protein [Moraxella bovis]|uniref:Uncharacterized protein n=1 Tax=Moraxella bovis TaxID=476 RepID=A0ABY6M2W4_MORBO|nr:hypothetical protein [Moraxella bovis]UZA02057.1 hypothetical protein LP092_08605 [Moraxella bovis]UZA18302.1 hypothetical protein LP088_08015 [Moraxella bovis]UZA36504.1 hypothetical protein LP098_05920 [Moraxella bovis]